MAERRVRGSGNPAGQLAAAEHPARELVELRGYDFHFSFGGGSHHAAHAASELPACLTWLWRDYDQTYEQSDEEKAKPPFRVRIYNR